MKTYDFRFISSQAEFDRGIVSAEYGAPAIADILKTCTFAEALAYLPVFATCLGVPNQSRFHVANDDRKPPGYNKARRHFDFNPAA